MKVKLLDSTSEGNRWTFTIEIVKGFWIWKKISIKDYSTQEGSVWLDRQGQRPSDSIEAILTGYWYDLEKE